jgi:hypothetical protein
VGRFQDSYYAAGGLMSWTAVSTELRAKDFLARLKAAEDRVSRKRYKRLLATTVAQVLALHPDFDLKKARRRAEKAAGALPVKQLLKAKRGTAAAAAAAALITGAGVLKAVKGTGVRRRKPPVARPPVSSEPTP